MCVRHPAALPYSSHMEEFVKMKEFPLNFTKQIYDDWGQVVSQMELAWGNRDSFGGLQLAFIECIDSNSKRTTLI